MNYGQNKPIKSFADLDAWEGAHKLVIMIYEISKNFSKEEVFGLTNQMRRAVVSITSDTAEGFSRQSYKDKIQFYSIAFGSLTELQSQVIATKDVGFMNQNDFSKVIDQSAVVHKILSGLIKSSKSRCL